MSIVYIICYITCGIFFSMVDYYDSKSRFIKVGIYSINDYKIMAIVMAVLVGVFWPIFAVIYLSYIIWTYIRKENTK